MNLAEVPNQSSLVTPDHPGQRGPMHLTDVEKAAVILAALGPKVAAMLLEGFDRPRIQRFAHAVNDMREINAETVDNTITEFLEHLEKEAGIAGGGDETRRFLEEFMEKEQVDQLMEDIQAKGRSVWSALNDVADPRILAWLKSEHPQVAAITLTKMTAAKTARLLEQLEPEFSSQLVLRMNQASSAPQEVTERIGKIIKEEFLPTAIVKKDRKDPPELIAAIMNHVSSGVRDHLMEHMETTTPALAETVRKFVFTYQDIPSRISGRDVSQILKVVDESVLLVALKSTGEAAIATSEFILSNISSRLATRLRDDLKEMPNPKAKEFEAAQSTVVAEIVGLRDQGVLKMIEVEAAEDE